MSESKVTEGKYSVFPFGPQHPVLPEPVHLKFIVEEEVIVDVVPQLGYVHRGIERACEINDYKRNIYTCSRICGICNFIHAETYCEGIEMLTGVEVPKRAKYLRSIWSELSRLQSHLLWLGLYADAIGLESLFMQIWRDREIILTLNEKTAGHRIHLDTNIIGGLRKDLPPELAKIYLSEFDVLEKKLNNIAPIFYKDKSFQEKTVGKGVLPKKNATMLGAVGPVIRGSGIKQDARKTGYAAYGELDFEPITYEQGDCYSRALVRFDEVYQSMNLIRKAIQQMPEGPISVQADRFPSGVAVHRTEQPRGEVFYYLEGNGTNKLSRCRIRTPTAANIPVLISMLIGYEVSDIPTIVHSIDPCISCTERIVRVKKEDV